MSDPRLDDWLHAVGFDTTAVADRLADDGTDDPWGTIDIAVTPLSDDQRAFLLGSPTFDEGPVDPALLAEADAAVIDVPDDPDDVEPF